LGGWNSTGFPTYRLQSFTFTDGTVLTRNDILAKKPVTGTVNNDTLSGGAADDWIDGGGDGDIIYGNDGDDVLQGGSGEYTIYSRRILIWS
jgi:Ca2+-binding RTX toxin-like protein